MTTLANMTAVGMTAAGSTGGPDGTRRRTPAAEIDAHLRVEVVDPAHAAWPAVRRQMERSGGRPGRLLVSGDGRLSARQTVVAAFLDGRPVAHACFSVHPARRTADAGRPAVYARMDSRSVDEPFADTAVEHVLLQVAETRARTMGCHGFAVAEIPPAQPRQPRLAA